MSIATIQCTRDTYISVASKTTNFAGASKLWTSETTESEVVGVSTQATALLQFAIPKDVQYKQITKAVLNYYLGTEYPNPSVIGSFSGVGYTPYLIDNTTDAITYNTVGAAGSLGENKLVERSCGINNWIAEDITDIFTNNLTNGIFSVFVGVGTYSSSIMMAYIGGISGGNGSYLTITYEDVEQLPPTITYPVDVYVRQGEDVLFSWVYNSLTAATQASVTLEWKAESATTYNVINLTQTAQSYLANIDFPAGTIDWRIKVTNDVGETSTYSEAKFVVIGKPAIPVITAVKNQTLTEITWNASDQCVYEISISDSVGNVLVSETVHSGETSYKPQLFLANGIYNIRLRTKNSIELWSDYTSKTVTISAVAPVQPTLALYPEKDMVRMKIEHASGTKAAILRSPEYEAYEVIAVLEDGVTEYVDKEMKSGVRYAYKARAYNTGYSDSAVKSTSAEFDGIYLQSDAGTIHLTSAEDKYMQHTETMEQEMALIKYSGRELPVAEYGEHRTRQAQKKAFVSHKDKKRFEEICHSEKVFYRDGDGNAFECAVSSVQYTRYMNAGYHVSFVVAEVEKEGVVLNV